MRWLVGARVLDRSGRDGWLRLLSGLLASVVASRKQSLGCVWGGTGRAAIWWQVKELRAGAFL